MLGDFSHLDFPPFKKEPLKTEQQEYFSWRTARSHNASFSSQGRRRPGPSPSAGGCSPDPARHTYPLVLWVTKSPACQAQHKCLLQQSPLPHAASAATASRDGVQSAIHQTFSSGTGRACGFTDESDGNKDPLRNSQSKTGGRDRNQDLQCPRGGRRHHGGPQKHHHHGA